MKDKIKWITRSAAAIALIVVAQAVTAPLKQQLLTGSLVNLILALTTMVFGWGVGAAAAVASPFIAYLLGINAQILVVPAIAVGNLTYVLVIAFLRKKLGDKVVSATVGSIISVAVAALCKFLVQYLLIVKWIAPSFLPEKAQGVMAVNFGVMQLFTACIGGTIASLLSPLVSKAFKDND